MRPVHDFPVGNGDVMNKATLAELVQGFGADADLRGGLGGGEKGGHAGTRCALRIMRSIGLSVTGAPFGW